MTDVPDWRRARWQATHQRIYDTALRLFAAEGYDHVPISRIATAAGVSVPTFYAHFPSKEHLIMALLEPEQVAELIVAQPADQPLGARIRQAAISVLTGFDAGEQSQLMARWRVIASSPGLRHRAGEFDRMTATMVAEANAGGRPVRPADMVVAGAHLSALTTGMLLWADSEGERTLADCLTEAFDALDQA